MKVIYIYIYSKQNQHTSHCEVNWEWKNFINIGTNDIPIYPIYIPSRGFLHWNDKVAILDNIKNGYKVNVILCIGTKKHSVPYAVWENVNFFKYTYLNTKNKVLWGRKKKEDDLGIWNDPMYIYFDDNAEWKDYYEKQEMIKNYMKKNQEIGKKFINNSPKEFETIQNIIWDENKNDSKESLNGWRFCGYTQEKYKLLDLNNILNDINKIGEPWKVEFKQGDMNLYKISDEVNNEWHTKCVVDIDKSKKEDYEKAKKWLSKKNHIIYNFLQSYNDENLISRLFCSMINNDENKCYCEYSLGEYGRIDVRLEKDKEIYLIENKVDSWFGDGQIDKYIEYVEKENEKRNGKTYKLLFIYPNYRKDIEKFLKQHEKNKKFEHHNYSEFIEKFIKKNNCSKSIMTLFYDTILPFTLENNFLDPNYIKLFDFLSEIKD